MDHRLHRYPSMEDRLQKFKPVLIAALSVSLILFALPAFAQSGLEGRITQTINAMIRVINILVIAFVVWSGFLIARGESSGFQKLIYSIVGMIIANGAYMIINYFT